MAPDLRRALLYEAAHRGRDRVPPPTMGLEERLRDREREREREGQKDLRLRAREFAQ